VGAFFETIGLRPGKLNATAAGSAELLGGALIALGLLIPLGAALLIAVMVTATITAHKGKGIWNDNGGFELPLVNVAAVFALAAVGAGDISLDAALDLDLASTGWALGALGAGLVGALGAVVQGRLFGSGTSSDTKAQGASRGDATNPLAIG
jgi:putative oxidoreductase